MSDISLSEWARDELLGARYGLSEAEDKRHIYITVMQLIDVFEQQHHTDKSRETALDLFNELARFHPLIEKQPDLWVPFNAGIFHKGDTVRVRADAFSDERGAVQNGRVGIIADARRGDVIFDSRDDKEPVLQGEHYRPEQLEGLMR